MAGAADVFGDVFGGGCKPCRWQKQQRAERQTRLLSSASTRQVKSGYRMSKSGQQHQRRTAPTLHCLLISKDTKMGTSNADISESTRAIEVSFAQGLFTKRPASNEIIK